MKKSAAFLKISALILGIAVLVAMWLFPKIWIIIFVVGAALMLCWVVYFKSVSYEIREDKLRISSGILFRKERVLSFGEILMTKQVSAAKKTLFTIVYFSGGRAVLFADLPPCRK